MLKKEGSFKNPSVDEDAVKKGIDASSERSPVSRESQDLVFGCGSRMQSGTVRIAGNRDFTVADSNTFLMAVISQDSEPLTEKKGSRRQLLIQL